MAAMTSTTFSTVGFVGGNNGGLLRGKKKSSLFMSAATAEDQQGQLNTIQQALKQKQTEEIQEKGSVKQPQPQSQHEQQFGVKSKNMSKEDGGQWLSCTTRHVRIYAAYIDPVTHVFDQTQTDKLTLILDPTNEFVWNKDTCNMVYTYFQELVDHYEGAPLNEYTLRLIGSDVEHYIRKMLFDGDIKYNMNARTLNFSMGKPRIRFNNPNSEDAQMQDVQK